MKELLRTRDFVNFDSVSRLCLTHGDGVGGRGGEGVEVGELNTGVGG